MLSFEGAIRATELLLAFAFVQHSAEHTLAGHRDRWLFVPRAVLGGALIFGSGVDYELLALTAHSILILRRFDGPYNGGSDRMGLLVLYCLTLAHWLPVGVPREAAFGYLGVQVVLSYFISGQVKIINPEWRSGRALQDVFRFSAYPVSEGLRGLSQWPRLLWGMSWCVMLFEVLFPLSFLTPQVLIAALVVAAVFHLANACLFGLNRFVWVWIAAYPSILWLQGRLMGGEVF